MALIIRIDVDRPYGKQPLLRHLLSRLSSDMYFPKIGPLGYLKELHTILHMLNESKARAYIFFRRCTLPSSSIMKLIEDGGHEIGLHLEDSRSFDHFVAEKHRLEKHVGRPVLAVSKHGSGGTKYGLHHYAPYEPDKYMAWARQCRMKLFLGNLENPSLGSSTDDAGLHVYPAAFWLEPSWRDTKTYTVDWLLAQAASSDIVVLLHPENVLADPVLTEEFKRLLLLLETRILA